VSSTDRLRSPAVCSWSLRPVSPADLVDAVRTCGLTAVQLALDPLRRGDWPVRATREALADAGIRVVSGMMEMVGEDYGTLESIRETGGVRPDATWVANLAAAAGNAAVAEELGLELVTFHAGFLPHAADDPERATMLDRLRAIAEAYAGRGIDVALETGQESAETLLDVLAAIGSEHVGVNFDPANMILYGMGDPVDAVRKLGPNIRQVHIKDAVATDTPGTWGREVPVGTGDVDWPVFLAAVDEVAPDVPLVIEREAGEQRATDVRTAVRQLEQWAGSTA
jgi:sugar phosphate isomerase/epimerase